MEIKASEFSDIFRYVIEAWHKGLDPELLSDEVLPHLLFEKVLVDTQQWHLEDEIRAKDIDPAKGMEIKHKIDTLNQHRTNLVEKIEDWFVSYFEKSGKALQNEYYTPTENPAWAIDRLSILELKIYHMVEQVDRTDVGEKHIARCKARLENLLRQRGELSMALDSLIELIKDGRAKMCVYRQEKLYNDPTTNPVLYKKV